MTGAVDLSGFKDRPQAPAANPTTPAGIESGPVAGPAPIIEVTEETFEAEVLERSMQVPVVVELFAGSMPETAAFSAHLEALAREQGGAWVLAKVDLDVSPRIAQAFQVQSVPAVIAVAAGRPLADFDGGVDQVGQWVDAVLSATAGKLSGPPPVEGTEPEAEPEDPRFVAAEDSLADGDLVAAEAGYQEILDAEPGNAQAQSAIRHVRFLARAQTLAPDAVAQAGAQPDSVAAQLDAADALLSSQQPEEAFGLLVAAIRRYTGEDKTAVRTRLLELFELFDPADAVVVAARRKLASALY